MSTSTNETQRFASVWDAITNTPDEAANLALRAQLMNAITDQIDAFGWSQSKAARNLNVQQPRISDLCTGKISRFSLDALVNMASALGIGLSIEPPSAEAVEEIRAHEMA
ncbi:helix-turn-helix domain-containing protein [Dietzia sp.]|uniref:helix-turn-helix domain-containing protein n=1 Tax=Dietzia sp. TaxID=1871616 RepID=UPI002FDAF3DF